MNDNPECKNPWLCSVLGFFLPLIGLVIGAIIGKGTGVKHALGGIALRYVLIVAGCLWVASRVSDIPRNETPARLASGKSDKLEADERTTWEVHKEKSPLDDSLTVSIRREAESPVHGGFRKSPAVLILRHKEGKSEAYVSWPMYLGNDKMPVTVRFDGDEAITDDWGCSTDGKAVFSPFPFSDFLETVLTSKRLVVRLTPYGESPETATFDISGLADVLDDEVRAAFDFGGM